MARGRVVVVLCQNPSKRPSTLTQFRLDFFLPDRLVMQGLPEELSHTSLRRLVVNNVLRILPSTGRTHCILVNSDGKSPRPRIMAINTEF
jgi:hypothetical protein